MITKDSGSRDYFQTGAQRDTSDSKPRPDLIPDDLLNALQVALGGAPFSIEDFFDYEHHAIDELFIRRDLIPDLMLNRLGGLYHRGAIKYTDDNWKKGIPLSRIYTSLFRHLLQWHMGDTSEDHLAAVIWNATALLWTEHQVAVGLLPRYLVDIGPLKNELYDGFYVPGLT